MGVNHPVSGRKAREALGATQSIVNKQARAMVDLATKQGEHAKVLDTHGRMLSGAEAREARIRARVDALEAFKDATFGARLRWLFRGTR